MDNEVNSMDYVVVQKDQLLEKIEANKATHIKLYNAAMSGYFLAVEDEMEKKVVAFREDVDRFEADFEVYQSEVDEAIEKRRKVEPEFRTFFSKFTRSFEAEYPVTFEAEYNAAIQKVKMSAYPKIRLTNEEFMKYVMNDWSWKADFKKSLFSNICFASGYFGADADALISGATYY